MLTYLSHFAGFFRSDTYAVLNAFLREGIEKEMLRDEK